MAEQLKMVSCDPICGFMLRSHDENEIVSLTMQHANKKHAEMKYTQVKGMIKPA